MNTDIRINVGFFQHHKTKKLIHRLGHAGAISLLTLWTYAAQNKPKGKLSGMDRLDIALAAGWEGSADLLVDTLTEMGFLDESRGIFSIHDWESHNPYAFHAEERSKQAREAAQIRWEHAKSKRTACAPHANSNAPSPVPNPNPNPNPSPKVKKFTPPSPEDVSEYAKERGENIDSYRFVDFYASKGWMVGKNKMKDWKAAVRNWISRDSQTKIVDPFDRLP